MKNILTIILVAMFCLGSVEAMAQRTITRQSTSQPVRPTKEQQYQKDLKAGEKLFNQEKYAEAKKHFAKMLGKYPNHKEDISGWIAACDVMLGDSAGTQVQVPQSQSSTSSASGFTNKTITVNGVSFKMVAVNGGTFTMGATSEQGSDASSSEKPTHSVTLSDYYIGETEVTQALWEAVMGSNPSSNKGSNLPVEGVNLYTCQDFINKLNSLTGLNFRLPTEAEWEYAARGGNKSKGYKYSGSNNIDHVAWYEGNSGYKTHAVKQKQANELGLYDMCGNVWEPCLDWYGDYSSSFQTNPTGPSCGEWRVIRGGSWGNDTKLCRVSYRAYEDPGPYGGSIYLGLRVCLSSVGSMYGYRQSSSSATSGLADKNFSVNGVSFKMVAVKGGTFTMGATSEQGSDVDSDEKPTHSVTLSDYYIGETEVTQALWEAVMGSNPSDCKGSNLPVESVSWDDCQNFINKLNSLTGLSFRLPTEAEWEYAARGGNKSKGYKYSGSNNIDQVAWYESNSGDKTHAVKQKQANELGLYDMSGNVYEWCLDWYGSYSSGSQTNPAGPSSGEYRVLRGSDWFRYARSCRVSYRISNSPGVRYNCYGLRVCLPSL